MCNPQFYAQGNLTAAENQTSVATINVGYYQDLTLTGVDAGLFVLDQNTRQLSFRSAPDFENAIDVGNDNVYDVSIVASPYPGYNFSEATGTFQIAVTNVNEAPTLSFTAVGTLVENTIVRTKVAEIIVNDPDASGNNNNLSINDQRFEIDGTSIYLKAGQDVDNQPGTTIDLTVTSIDGQLFASGVVSITVVEEDTTAPTLTVNIVDSTLNFSDQVSDVVFTFSEAVQDFTLADVTATGGTLSALSGPSIVNGATVYTAAFTAAANFSGSGTIGVAAGSYTDTAGNAGGAGSDTVTINTVVPGSGNPTPPASNEPISATPEGGILVGTAGADVFQGDDGLDYVRYNGAIEDYVVVTDTSGQVIGINGPEGNDRFDGIERLIFSDGILAFDEPAKQNYRLYEAAFDRDPDTAGLSFWVGLRDEGERDLIETAKDFLYSSEFTTRFGSVQQMSNSDIVELFYQNVLDRSGEPAGAAYWQDMLDEGISREHVLVLFSESLENHQTVDVELTGGVRLDLSLI